MEAKWKWTSNVKITAFDLDGNIKDVQEFHNIITTVGKNLLRDFLHGKSGAADASEANRLHDADGGFDANDVGKVLYNTTDTTFTTVSGFVDAGELTLTDDIMVDGESYELCPTGAGIEYIELGNDNTTPLVTDTALLGYIFRKARTSRSKPADGQVKTTFYIAPDEAHVQLEELGWWMGAGAGAGAATGIMVSRVLYSRLKTEEESLQIERTDTITEV